MDLTQRSAGVLLHITSHPDHRYLIGPVSISGGYSRFSRRLITEFVRKYHYDEALAKHVKPRNRFHIGLGNRLRTDHRGGLGQGRDGNQAGSEGNNGQSRFDGHLNNLLKIISERAFAHPLNDAKAGSLQ